MQKGTTIGIIIVIIVVLAVAVFELKQPAKEPVQPNTSVVITPPSTPDVRPPPKILSIPVTLTKQFFNPAAITVNAGDVVTLQITSPDLNHYLTIPEFDVQATIAAGTKEAVKFTTKEPGTVLVTCADNCDEGVVLTITVK